VKVTPPAPTRRIGAEDLDGLLDVHELLREVVEGGASDLHLTAGRPPMMRVHGDLQPLDYPEFEPVVLQKVIYGVLTQRQRERLENDSDLDFSYAAPGISRFRANVFVQKGSLGAVFRVIPFEVASAEDLGLPAQVAEFANLQRGLVLVTGATGTGKSTTLASVLDLINRRRPVHIMTVEDPIEFLHTHRTAIVNQREVGEDVRSFAEALRHVLRQDPDVILVGEMRDLETIQMAITAAETGHLVFATLHTQDAPQTIDRIVDVFPPHQQQQVRVQLAGSLQAIVAQQLLKSARGEGRVAAFEVLIATSGVRNLIREGKTHQIYSMMQAGAQHGMQTMDACLAELVKHGRVTHEEALERCHNSEEFAALVRGGSRQGHPRPRVVR
jgi:twitching motility protein PilT